MTAYEHAQSLFTGWMRSCWSCLSPSNENSPIHRENDREVQREVPACQTQPHLVQPMKLVVYDDLPSPSVHNQHRNSLSSWVMEGRNLASRASMTLKRHSTAAPLKIGTPTDFRRVQSFHPQMSSTNYQPLELKIHQSGSRLPDLPEFDTFQLDEDAPHRRTLAVPPRTLAPSGLRSRRCQSTVSAITRKPVGSGNRQSWNPREPVIQPPAPARTVSALIPHFSIVHTAEMMGRQPSIRSSVPSSISISTSSQSDLADTEPAMHTEWPSHAATTRALENEEPPQTPQTPRAMKMQDGYDADELSSSPPFNSKDSPSSASSRTMPSQISSLHRPSVSLSEKRRTIASLPSLSNRVTQWFFPGKVIPPQSVSLAGEDGFSWERTRTLSGSTMASTVTTTITGGANTRRPNMSISSTFTSASSPRTSLRGPSPTAEKEVDLAFSHPTIYESRQ
ncbi:hypothetical protein N7512_000005 [Penicillium capsulatum]|nr:hypothetical protein N7512_000005 [Penicillium capsulatum]